VKDPRADHDTYPYSDHIGCPICIDRLNAALPKTAQALRDAAQLPDAPALVCSHGQLARQCELCAHIREIERLDGEVGEARLARKFAEKQRDEWEERANTAHRQYAEIVAGERQRAFEEAAQRCDILAKVDGEVGRAAERCARVIRAMK
jgi:hypothetical protein